MQSGCLSPTLKYFFIHPYTSTRRTGDGRSISQPSRHSQPVFHSLTSRHDDITNPTRVVVLVFGTRGCCCHSHSFPYSHSSIHQNQRRLDQQQQLFSKKKTPRTKKIKSQVQREKCFLFASISVVHRCFSTEFSSEFLVESVCAHGDGQQG